jgi:hypothetical protein
VSEENDIRIIQQEFRVSNSQAFTGWTEKKSGETGTSTYIRLPEFLKEIPITRLFISSDEKRDVR